MRRSAPIVVLVACLSLFGMQLGGLHLHAGAEGFDASPHLRHVHGSVVRHAHGTAKDSSRYAAADYKSPDRHSSEHVTHSDDHGRSGDHGPMHDPIEHERHGDHDLAHRDLAHHDMPDHGHTNNHDHAGDRDISVVELGAGASKLLVFLVWLGPGLLLLLRSPLRFRPPQILPPPRNRRERWRPPLRAPPALSLSS